MIGRRIGYGCVGNERDAGSQRAALTAAGVASVEIFLDEGGSRGRPQLREALAGCGRGDTLVVTALSVLARSARDLHSITTTLEARGVIVEVADLVFDPNDDSGAVFFSTVALVAALGRDSSRQRRPAPQPRPVRARSRGAKTALGEADDDELVLLHATGEHTIAELAARFRVSRSTVYRIAERHARDQRNPG